MAVKIEIIEWTGPAQMDTGAPMPCVFLTESQLFVSYIVADHVAELSGELEEYAIVRFDGVLQHTFGYPNEDVLAQHPLYKYGLKYYRFNEIINSPTLAKLADQNEACYPGTKERINSNKHWIVAFHDETLEVLANKVFYLGNIKANDGHTAINDYLRKI